MKNITPEVLQIGMSSPEPIYVYDLDKLTRRCEQIKELHIKNKKIFFATMANDHPTFLSCIRTNGFGVFVNSPKHLRLALDLGFHPQQIIYAASNMTSNEISQCLEEKINLVLDSIGQIRALGQVASGEVAIGIRLNVGTAINGHNIKADPEYRFGLIPEEVPKALEITRHYNIRIIGAHSYFGTGIMRPEILLEGLVRLGGFAHRLPDLRYIDVGGGFGVPNCLEDDEFDINAYAEGAEQVLSCLKARWGNDLDLYIEPGRYLAADCGYFFVKVVDIKYREDRIFVGTNASVANFPRPLLYPETAIHPCMIAGKRNGAPPHEKPIYICGNSTYSRDFLARAATLPLPHPGDTLIFYNAGAYSRSMISNFLGKDRPQEAFTGL